MPLTVFKKALIGAAPSAFPVASPLLLTATIPLGLALQVTDADISCVLASLYLAIAFNGLECSGVKVMLCGDNAIDTNVGCATARASLAVNHPSLAVTLAVPGERS